MRRKRGLTKGQNVWWLGQMRLPSGRFGSVCEELNKVRRKKYG